MTEEQLRTLLQSAADQVQNLEAERDSFKEENDKLKENEKKLSGELQQTKKLNFTLARSLDTSGRTKGVEDTLHEMFK
jgi:peptidoglycan hydrolase CwlO-like protein